MIRAVVSAPIARFGIGAVLGLTPAQSAPRLPQLRADTEPDVWIVVAPVEFKRGEALFVDERLARRSSIEQLRLDDAPPSKTEMGSVDDEPPPKTEAPAAEPALPLLVERPEGE